MDYSKFPKIALRDWLRGDVGGQTYAGLTDPNSAERPGANFIYDDIPLDTLSSTSYPRISITRISKHKVTRGGRSTLSYDRIHLQIDIYTAKRLTNLSVGGTAYDHQQLCDILGQQIQEALTDYFTEDMFNTYGLYLPTEENWLVNDLEARRDDTRDENVWIKTFEIVLRGFNTGE